MGTKIIAMYLPQYHEIPENNEFWGEGFTDWVGVKNARPLYEGQHQPKVPLNENYYDLSNPETIRWQANLAKEYGVYGFGIYHYWFSSEKQLLTKPAEIILQNKDIEIPFLFAWDNISWRRTWSKMKGNAWSPLQDANQNQKGPEILVEYKLGDKEEWKKHFEYLLPYFRDERYIKTENKPIFVMFHYDENVFAMEEYWKHLAKENGLAGIKIIYRYDSRKKKDKNHSYFRYEPITSAWGSLTTRLHNKAKNEFCNLLGKERKLEVYSYDDVWRKIINQAKEPDEEYTGAFVSYDDTPRRGKQGKVIKGATPESFEANLKELLTITNRQQKKYLFLTAWNEWGEGAYLEPDTENGYAYLEALIRAVHSGTKRETR